jgi:hypothetical protein
MKTAAFSLASAGLLALARAQDDLTVLPGPTDVSVVPSDIMSIPEGEFPSDSSVIPVESDTWSASLPVLTPSDGVTVSASLPILTLTSSDGSATVTETVTPTDSAHETTNSGSGGGDVTLTSAVTVSGGSNTTITTASPTTSDDDSSQTSSDGEEPTESGGNGDGGEDAAGMLSPATGALFALVMAALAI